MRTTRCGVIALVAMTLLPVTVLAGARAESNVETIQQLYGHFGSGNVEGVLELLSDDFVQVMPGAPDTIPWAGSYRGHDGFLQFLGVLSEHAEVAFQEHREFIAQGAHVVVLIHEGLLLKPTGRTVEFDAVHVWMLDASGMVTRLQIFEDTAPLEAGFRA